MQITTFDDGSWTRVEHHGSRKAWAQQLAHGTGEAHVRLVRFGTGGHRGPHETGRGHLFLPLSGSGWVREGEGARRPITVGQAAIFPRVVVHEKGSEHGMVGLMIQVPDLAPGGGL